MRAQTDTVMITPRGHFYYEHFLPYSAYTAVIHSGGEPYVYAASRELGMVTFDISDADAPVPVDTIPQSAFNGLTPNNVSQHEGHLYVAVGGYNLVSQSAGLAILSLADPAHPSIMDQWDSTAFDQGAAIAISDGAYAYLGAMDAGVVILDVSDKSDIRFVSSILPDPNYPETPDLFSVPNARGMELYGEDTLMVAYDAGGLRMLDISDKEMPIEIGKYADTGIEAIAQSAYNNIAIKEHYAYVPVDMCGLLTIDIADAEMSTTTWFNPWDCDTTNWVGRPGHTNEVRIAGEDLLFVSGGDSELLVFDISTASNPVLKGVYGIAGDSLVAWGLDVEGDLISLALIDNSWVGFPYFSDKGGIQLLSFEQMLTVSNDSWDIQSVQVYPNPVADYFYLAGLQSGAQTLHILDITGKPVYTGNTDGAINVSGLPGGIYCFYLTNATGVVTGSGNFLKK